jgi:hypothetical protein
MTLNKWERKEVAIELNGLRKLRHQIRKTLKEQKSNWLYIKLNKINLMIEDCQNRG